MGLRRCCISYVYPSLIQKMNDSGTAVVAMYNPSIRCGSLFHVLMRPLILQDARATCTPSPHRQCHTDQRLSILTCCRSNRYDDQVQEPYTYRHVCTVRRRAVRLRPGS